MRAQTPPLRSASDRSRRLPAVDVDRACRATWQKELEQRIARGIAEGDVPASASPAALASFYMAVTQGMALHAKDGASKKHLEQIAATAMQAWPAKLARASRR